MKEEEREVEGRSAREGDTDRREEYKRRRERLKGGVEEKEIQTEGRSGREGERG